VKNSLTSLLQQNKCGMMHNLELHIHSIDPGIFTYNSTQLDNGFRNIFKGNSHKHDTSVMSF